MGDIIRTIAANSGQDVAASGNYIFLKSANANVRVVVDQQYVHMQAGDRWDIPQGFKGFRIENETAGSISAEFIVDRGAYVRSEVTGSITLTSGANIIINNHTVGAASATLLAADTTRRSVAITNTSTAETIYINVGGAATVLDFPIYPRETLVLDKSATVAITAIRGGAANVDVRTLQELD